MWTALVCGAAVFPGLFCGFRTVLRWRFPRWREVDVVSVSESLVSAVHASLATVSGAITVTSCKDVMTDSHWLVNNFILFGAPYMAFDIFAMYLIHYHKQRVKGHSGDHSIQMVRSFLLRDTLLVLHHAALLLVFMPVSLLLRRGLGDFFIGCFFLTELSTPFICFGHILIQLGLDNSILHKINGVVVLLCFFTCRILLFPFMYWAYGRQLGIPLHRVPAHLPLHCNLGNLVILAPQIYWYILLLRKAKRLYMRRRTQQAEADKPKAE